MDDGSYEARRARAEDVLKTIRGAEDPRAAAEALENAHGPLGSLGLSFAYGDIWSRPGLSRRDRSLAVIAMLTALREREQLRTHVRGGHNHGLSPAELREIMVQAGAYAGFPCAHAGMDIVNEVLQKLGLDARPESAAPKSDAQRTADGASVSATLNASPAQDPGQALAGIESRLGVVGRFAFQFALGEVWARSQLSRRDRSVVVVSILTVLARAPELRIHMRGAINHGVTPAEIEELLLLAVVYAGFPVGVEGTRALQEVLEAMKPPSGG